LEGHRQDTLGRTVVGRRSREHPKCGLLYLLFGGQELELGILSRGTGRFDRPEGVFKARNACCGLGPPKKRLGRAEKRFDGCQGVHVNSSYLT